MDEQILELVVYKIKHDHINSFREGKLQRLRSLIQGFEGLIDMETFGALTEERLFVDQLEWEDQACAQRAADKIKMLEEEEPFASIFDAFEEIKMFQQFKKIA